MGSSTINAGNKGAPREAGRPAGASSSIAGEARVSGAMTQQYGDGGRANASEPQKFVRLVGCRDPNARTGPWIRPRPPQSKR